MMCDQMTYNEAINYIDSFKKFGSKLRLDPLQQLLELMGNPHDKLKFIHIAGTNGKGSTALICANILIESKLTTGLFTSPHIINFRERFQVNGIMITEEELAWIVSTTRPFIESIQAKGLIITHFELITAIAFAFFIYKKCDIVCLEVGLGGTSDATNIIKNPLVCVITSISIDHTQVLGDTIQQITKEKSGIIKENSTVVCYPLLSSSIREIILDKANTLKDCTVINPSTETLTIEKISLEKTVFNYDSTNYELNLLGAHQVYNCITAIEAVNCLNNLNKSKFKISQLNVIKGVNNTRIPARFEIFSRDPLIVIDGAHNLDGIDKLIDTLTLINKKKIIVLGMLKDKDYKSIINNIATVSYLIVSVTINDERALSAKEIFEFCKSNDINCIESESTIDAVKIAKKYCSYDSCIVVCGSLYLASQIRDDLI